MPPPGFADQCGEAVPEHREAERRGGHRSREDLHREQRRDQQVRGSEQAEALVSANHLPEEVAEECAHRDLREYAADR
jgi:hypothetical protein